MNTNTLERIKNSVVIKIEDSQSIKYYYNWDGISFLTEIKDGVIYTLNQDNFSSMNEPDKLIEAILEHILPDISINLNTNKPEFIFGRYSDTYVYLNIFGRVVNDIPTYALVSDKGTMFVEDHGYFVNMVSDKGKQTYSKVVARKLIEVLEMLRCKDLNQTNEACNYTKTIEDIKSSKYNDLEAYTLLINGVTRIEYDGNCYYVTTSISDDEDSDEWHFHHDDLDVVIEYLQFVKRHI